MRKSIAAAIAALSVLAPGALHRRVIDPASPQIVQWTGRRRGVSAKSPFANREQRVQRLALARGVGSYMHADALVDSGLHQGIPNPARRVQKALRDWLAGLKGTETLSPEMFE